MRSATSMFKSGMTIRHAPLAFLFIFIIWQLSSTLHTSQWVAQRTRSNNSHAYLGYPYHNTAGIDTPENGPAKHGDASPTSNFIPAYPEPKSNNYPETRKPYNSIQPTLNLPSRVAKVTSLFYDVNTRNSRVYERALLTHRPHNNNFGYPHFVQRRTTLGPWSKHAYLFSIIVEELAKPASERLEWLFWHDADTVLMNSMVPLETFLPPSSKEWEHVNFLATNDLGGLNDGVFFARVCDWSASLFSAAFSFPYFNPTISLRNDEQGALGFLLSEPKFQNNTIHIPHHWINSLQSFGEDAAIPPEWKTYKLTWFKPGDMLVHFPGSTQDQRPGIMEEYFERLTNAWSIYNIPLSELPVHNDTISWWETEAVNEQDTQDEFWRQYHLVRHDVGPSQDDITRAGEKKILKTFAEKPQEDIDAALEKYRKLREGEKMEAYRKARQEILDGIRTDKTMVE